MKFIKTDRHKKWFAVGLTVLIAELFTLWGIYVVEEYGIFLFFAVPLLIGAGSVVLYGYRNSINFRQARHIAFLSLGIYAFCLMLFAIEGLVCILMAFPIALLFTWIGAIVGHSAVSKKPKNISSTFFIVVLSLPALSFLEKNIDPELTSVVSSIEINASPETVWKNVIEFPQLKEPEEFIFKTGIAYPINAKISGQGVGAVRHCNFTTGSFVEPVTVWDAPKLLRFSVEQQPAPLKEMGFWDIDAPHLHDYFVSRQGQFKLIPLPNGNTRLEGTTWYYNDIKPAFYWRIWSDYIIHKIHNRVLEHIKVNAEMQSGQNAKAHE